MKKFNFRSVSDFLSDEQMKREAGGIAGCLVIKCVGDPIIYYAAECGYADCEFAGGYEYCVPC